MALEIVGKLDMKLPVQSGNSNRGPWKKQDFIIETPGQYPKKVCINVWGEDKVKDLEAFKEGDILKVSINIESREYNGRWYTDIKAWRIETNVADSPSNMPSTPPPMPVSEPLGAPSDNSSDESDDDLPF
ncbi:MAG: DUF3127 domain-containing protein [Bacteroidales bacterium]